ncbi:hypothetical protein BDP27DRAFT_1253488 [Rhodocollybia butyracea]|uniref:F-box domain-containing protein n=1 Tax=Rhodocollybia butyracea TaxID=206335 RepID=A0A9P5Q3N3_9AGAR|nr:hypothetical protein BDP27DRAFT_1253488 [Rhodocollybia butyracea]
MPSTLRRKHHQELTLRKSFLEAMRVKLSLFRRPSDKSSPRPTETWRRDYNSSYEPYYHASSIIRPPLAYYPPHSIRNLPPELLAYIFVMGSEDDPILPLTITHICRFWRVLALNTPLLWRRVVLGSYYSMWRETMYRARACTLDIEFKSPGRYGSLAFYEVQRYMHLVIPQIRRWRSLSIVFSDYQPYLWNAALSECCSRNNHTQVPELEELCLVYRHNDDTKEFCLFSGYAPSLRRVTIDGIRLTWLPSLFQNLRYLDYIHHGWTNGSHAIQEVSNILRVSSRLAELRILFPVKKYRPRLNHRISPDFETIYLPRLESLHLRVNSQDIPEELISLASLFETPRLSDLHLVDSRQRQRAFPNVNIFWTLYPIPPLLRTVHLQHGWFEAARYFSQFASIVQGQL